jgi:sensor histidine kinase regulating citrate/malate metabolism
VARQLFAIQAVVVLVVVLGTMLAAYWRTGQANVETSREKVLAVAHSVAQRLTDQIIAPVAEPVLAALLIGKAAEASERGVELAVADDILVPTGAADPQDLVTITGNLFDNALDATLATPPPRRIEVGARVVVAVDRGDEYLVLPVVDTGSGIDPANVERAFRRGWSTKDSDRLPGRGLGLALVSRSVQRYGGTIEVTKEAGAVFTVHLPLRRTSLRVHPATPPGREPEAPKVGAVTGHGSP